MILDSPQEDLLLLGAVDSEAQGAPEHTSHQGNPRYVALRSPPPPPPATPFSSSTFFHRFLIQKTVLPDARSRQAVIKSQAVSHDGIFSTLESTLKFHLWGLVLIIKSLMLELGSCLWKWIQSFERLTCGGQIGHPSIWPVLLENAACAFIVGHSVFFFFFLILSFIWSFLEGIDFYYSSKQHAQKMVDFLQCTVPCRYEGWTLWFIHMCI